MSVKLVNETWKRRTKRKDVDHSLLFQRLDKHQRMLHMMQCAPCLNSAVNAVNRFKRQITSFIEEYEAYGTVSGRVYPHNPFTGGDAPASGYVGATAEASG